MSKSLLIIKDKVFVYKEKEYLYDECYEIKSELNKNIEVIILEEELYSRHFIENLKKKDIYDFIDVKLNKEFHKTDDILYHYEYDKSKKVISIYSIKGGKRLDLLCDKCEEIKITPIQFIFKELIMKIIGEKGLDEKYIIYFEKNYYYISLKSGKFYDSFVEKDLNDLLKRINNVTLKDQLNKKDLRLYVDRRTFEFSKNIYNKLNTNINLECINCEEFLNEKIHKKQKFYFKKVL